MTKPAPNPIDPEELTTLAAAVIAADHFPQLATIDGDQPRLRPVSPVLTDGFINQFDIEPIPGNKIINSGPFTVSLEFLNNNAGMFFSPSVVHDGNGCQSGKNLVFAIPGGWQNACALGVTGDWRIAVQYRRAAKATTRNGGTNPLSFTAVPIAILRGFISSGTLRFRST